MACFFSHAGSLGDKSHSAQQQRSFEGEEQKILDYLVEECCGFRVREDGCEIVQTLHSDYKEVWGAEVEENQLLEEKVLQCDVLREVSRKTNAMLAIFEPFCNS